MGVKVSICIPCYNNAEEVKRLLDSIYRQDYTDFEINISDDSTDNATETLVREHYPGVNYCHNPKPYGHIFNWNAAIRMAQGTYIKILFSDDWFTFSDSLSKLVELLDNNPKAALAFSGSRQVLLDSQNTTMLHHALENSKASYDRSADKEFVDRLRRDYKNLFLGNQIGAPSATLYRRDSELTFFDERSNWASDMFLYFDLLQKNPIFAYTTEPLVSIGVHENQYTESFSEKDNRIYEDYRYMYMKYHLQESVACRAYFTEKFILKYHRGLREAKELGIDKQMFWSRWIIEQKATIQCFLQNKLRLHSAGRKQ